MRAAALVLAVWVTVFSGTSAQAAEPVGQIGLMDSMELAQKLQERRQGAVGFHLVDLRNEADYAADFIPGAINIPLKKLSFVGEKIFAKSDQIVFYSYAGADHISENAVIQMKNKGFNNTYVLIGGIGAWSQEIEFSLLDETDNKGEDS